MAFRSIHLPSSKSDVWIKSMVLSNRERRVFVHTYSGIKPRSEIVSLKGAPLFKVVVIIVMFFSFILAPNVPVEPKLMSMPMRISPSGFTLNTSVMENSDHLEGSGRVGDDMAMFLSLYSWISGVVAMGISPRKLLISIPILSITVLPSIYAAAAPSLPKPFDHYKLTLQVPGFFMNNPPPAFTIHGIWPSLFCVHAFCQPKYCNPSDVFNVRNIEDLLPTMSVEWPNFNPKNTDQGFWRHEWKKHGTCSRFDQHTYFNTALRLKGKYNIFQTLQKKQITPNRNLIHNSKDFLKTLSDELKFQPSLECATHDNEDYRLKEIKICINKNSLVATNCIPLYRNNCRKSFKYY